MIIERDRGTKGWEKPCQVSFSRDKPMVCDHFWKIFTALLISYSFPLFAIRVYFHMKQQSCSCSAHILPPLLPLWTWPWVCLNVEVSTSSPMQVTQSRSNTLKAFFSYKYASWKWITSLGASSSLHIACNVTGEGKGRVRPVLGEAGMQSSHYGTRCI